MSTLYVAFNTIAREDFENYLSEPRAPSNYKDQYKIAEYISTARHKQIEEAADRPMTSTLGQVRFAEHANGETKQFLLKKDQLLIDAIGNYQIIACINAPTFLRMVRFELVEKIKYIDESYRWIVFPEMVAGRKPFVFDPIVRLLGSEAAENTDPWLVARRFLGCDDETFSKNYTGMEGKVRLTVALSGLLGV